MQKLTALLYLRVADSTTAKRGVQEGSPVGVRKGRRVWGAVQRAVGAGRASLMMNNISPGLISPSS